MAIIQRAPGDRPGPSITDSVLTTDEACMERGRQEINYHMYDRQLDVGSLVATSFIKPGSIVQLQTRGEVVNGKASAFSLSVSVSESGVGVQSNINLDFLK